MRGWGGVGCALEHGCKRGHMKVVVGVRRRFAMAKQRLLRTSATTGVPARFRDPGGREVESGEPVMSTERTRKE